MIFLRTILLLLALCTYSSLTYDPKDHLNFESVEASQNVSGRRFERGVSHSYRLPNTLIAQLSHLLCMTGFCMVEDMFQNMMTKLRDLIRRGVGSKTEDDEEHYCLIDVKELDDCHPLIFKSDKELEKLYYPNEKGYIMMKKGETVYVSCNDGVKLVHNTFLGRSELKVHSTVAKCFKNTLFDSTDVQGMFHYPNLQCAEPTTYQVFSNSSDEFSVGFEIDRKKEVYFIKGSINKQSGFADYVISAQTSLRPENKQPIYEFNEWDDGRYRDLMGTNVEACIYKDAPQEISIKNYIECEVASGRELVKADGGCVSNFCPYNLERTALAPTTGFVYLAQSAATSIYLNAAPMIASVRYGNWKSVEDQVSAMAFNRYLDKEFITITGVYKYLRWPTFEPTQPTSRSSAYMKKEFYFCEELPNTKALAMTIPRFFWKIIYNPIGDTNYAFIVSNNPFLKPEDYKAERLCDNEFNFNDKFPNSWIGPIVKSLKNDIPSRGYVHICRMNDFLEVVRNDIPSLMNYFEDLETLNAQRQNHKSTPTQPLLPYVHDPGTL